MILTISIPTYNRSRELEDLLSEILLQAKEVRPGSFNVLVSDNASTDNTAHMVETMRRRFAAQSLELKYIHNDENVGFSRNVISAVGNADGEFVLIMGDDDGLEPNTIGLLIDKLQGFGGLDIVFLKSLEYDESLSYPTSSESEENISGEQFYADGIEYIYSRKGYPPALVSGYVVRRSAWVSSAPEDFAYSICVHMLTAARMLLGHSGAAEITRPCIKYRGNQQNTTWSRDELYPFRFYLDSLQATKIMAVESDHRGLEILRSLSLRTILFYLLRQKITGHPFAREQFLRYYRNARGQFGLYSFAISFLWIVPGFLLRIVFGRWMKKINERTGFAWNEESNQ